MMRLFSLLLAGLLSTATLGQVRAAKAAPARPAAKPVPVPAAAPASFAVTVSGSITDADGLPLPGATVWQAGRRGVMAVTNAQGEFSLTLPSNAAVTLTCGYAGFDNQSISLRQPHRYNEFVIALEPTARRPR